MPFYNEMQDIDDLNLALIIDFTAEFSEKILINKRIKYISLPTLDGCTVSFNNLVKGINLIKETSGNILIHCALGHGRSVMFVAFYLALNYNLSSKEALQQIYKVRPTAKLNKLQLIQLKNNIQLFLNQNSL